MSTPLDQLGSELVVAAARLVRAARRVVDQPTGMRVLSILDERSALSITELAEADRCSQPTMSGTVHTLLDNGWVTKEPDPDDARRSVIGLTDEGREVIAAFRAEVGQVIGDRLRASGAHGAADVERVIEVLHGVLDAAPTNSRKGQL